MTARPRPRTVLVSLSVMALATAGLTGCQGDSVAQGGSGSSRGVQEAGDGATAQPRVSLNVRRGAQDVPVDTLLDVSAQDATIDSVSVSSAAPDVPDVPGQVSDDGTSWEAQERLEPGVVYTVRTTAHDAEGDAVDSVARFRTQDLSLAQQTYASIAPLDGETVGVGMPVIVTFDVPVTDRASMEEHMSVESTPQQPGTWHWISDTEVHWRPRTYWKAGTDVHVDLDVNGVDAGGGIYGQHDREIEFTVGDAHIYRVDA
ncbi:MAG TPA: Ig-like domain-containing protein, partial [Acidimicrobiales bacterium]